VRLVHAATPKGYIMLTLLVGLAVFALFFLFVQRVITNDLLKNVGYVILAIVALVWILQTLPLLGVHVPAILTR
jgi:predicted membrane channel-forming protein YqfA (hemolysin III family)